MTMIQRPVIIRMEKGVAEKRLRPNIVLSSLRDRHLAEWRSLLFTVIVTVNPKI